MYIEFQGKLEGKDFEENEMENNVSGQKKADNEDNNKYQGSIVKGSQIPHAIFMVETSTVHTHENQ